MGEHVTGVIPASALGLLPAPLDASSSMSTNQRRDPPKTKIETVLERHDVNRAASSGVPSEEIMEDEVATEESNYTGTTATAVPPLMLLEQLLHLFGHGTPLSLELELNRVGEEALRALRTPDVSIREYPQR